MTPILITSWAFEETVAARRLSPASNRNQRLRSCVMFLTPYEMRGACFPGLATENQKTLSRTTSLPLSESLAGIMHNLSTAVPQSSTLTALCFLGLLGVLHEYACGALRRTPYHRGACGTSSRKLCIIPADCHRLNLWGEVIGSEVLVSTATHWNPNCNPPRIQKKGNSRNSDC